MKKKKSSLVGTIVFLILLSAVIIGIYLKITSGKDKGAKEIPAETSEADTLIKKDLYFEYPATPREVLKLYCRITKCLYNDDLTDEQIRKLVIQVRDLYDAELLANNDEDEQISFIKSEVAEYRKDKKTIYAYTIDSATNTNYIDTKAGKTAIIKMYFTLKAGGNMDRAYEEFSLVEDSNGRWKIAGWKAADKQSWE